MVTVPIYIAELFKPQLAAAELTALSDCGRMVGNRVEVDLDLVAALIGPDIAEAFYRHYLACRDFDGRARSGVAATVYLQRTLLDAAQCTSKPNRSDLVAQVEALEVVPGVGDVISELTGANPDLDLLRVLGDPFHIRIFKKDEQLRTTFVVDSCLDWLPELGGPASSGEVRRGFDAVTNYAAWRDRRVRRLTRLTVVCEERWPAPAVLERGSLFAGVGD